jgi:hypothetical protein
MKVPNTILRILIGPSIGLAVGALLEWATSELWHPILLITCVFIGVLVTLVTEATRPARLAMKSILDGQGPGLEHLPARIADFVKQVVRKMRYHKKVRADVMVELTGHFEDALKECKNDQEKQQKARQLISEFGDAKLLGVLLRRAKKRCRPHWRTVVARTFQTAGVLILCFIGYCFYISLGKPTISVDYLEEMTRLNRPVVDESLNAAPFYQKAIDAYEDPPEVSMERNVYGRKAKWLKGNKAGLLKAIQDRDWIGDLNEEELAALKQWISSNAQAAEFFKQASQRPYCWWNWQTEDNIVFQIDFGRLAPIRDLTKLMCWQAKLKAHNGDFEAALQDIQACYRVGKHFKGPRMLIEQLVATAIQALAARSGFIVLSHTEMEHTLLKKLQDQMQKLLDQDTFVINYQTERFFALDFLQRCYTDDGDGSGHMIPGRFRQYWQMIDDDEPDSELLAYGDSLAKALAIADRREMWTEFERMYRTAEDWALKTPWQLRQEGVDLEMGLDEWSRLKQARYWPVAALTPAMGRIAELSYRCKTEIQAFTTTVAILRFRQIHGFYPDDLYQLLKTDLLETLPMDPYSDKPLVYRRIGDDFTLYSLGENFADDGAARYGDSWKWGDGRRKGDRVFWPVETREQREKRLDEQTNPPGARRYKRGRVR